MADEYFDDIAQHVKDNYEQLVTERGLSWEQAAQDHASGDPRLAAWMRSRAAQDGQATSTGAPKGRKPRGSAKAALADAEPTEDAEPTGPAEPTEPTEPAEK